MRCVVNRERIGRVALISVVLGAGMMLAPSWRPYALAAEPAPQPEAKPDEAAAHYKKAMAHLFGRDGVGRDRAAAMRLLDKAAAAGHHGAARLMADARAAEAADSNPGMNLRPWPPGSGLEPLPPEQTAAAAQRLAADPFDLASRAIMAQSTPLRGGDGRAGEHVAWMVEHCPGIELYSIRHGVWPTPQEHARLAALWLKQIEANPKDAAVLANAAAFFKQSEPLRAVELWRRALALEPDNPRRAAALLSHCESEMVDAEGDEKPPLAAGRLAALEATLARTDDPAARIQMLPTAAMCAAEVGERAKAEALGNEILEFVRKEAARRQGAVAPEPGKPPPPPAEKEFAGAVHYAHVAMGRAALAAGDVEAARVHLVESGKPRLPKPAPMNPWGFGRNPARFVGGVWVFAASPNLSLAKDMLSAGEADAVVAHLEQLKQTAPVRASYDRWIRKIRAGVKPTFWPNLVY